MFDIAPCIECPKYVKENWANCPKCRRELKSETEFMQDLIDAASRLTSGYGSSPNKEIVYAIDGKVDNSGQHSSTFRNPNDQCPTCASDHKYRLQDIDSTNKANRKYVVRNQHLWWLIKSKINRVFGGTCIMAYARNDPGNFTAGTITDEAADALKRIYHYSPNQTLLSMHVKYMRKHNDVIYCGWTVLFFEPAEVEKFIPLFVGKNWIHLAFPIQAKNQQSIEHNIPKYYGLADCIDYYEDLLALESLKELLI